MIGTPTLLARADEVIEWWDGASSSRCSAGGSRVAARIAHEMKDLDAKQTMLQGIMFVLQ